MVGSGELIGLGGAGASSITGTAGALVNPSALGVRPSTENGKWSFDWHVDWLNPDLGTDTDNNGVRGDVRNSLITVGLAVLYKKWALGFTSTSLKFRERASDFQASTLNGQIVLARTFAKEQWTVGAGFRFGSLEFDQGGTRLLDVGGSSVTSGVTYRPSEKNYRLGAALNLSVGGKEVRTQSCDPLDCNGYILPESVALPAEFRAGFSYRFSKSKWNRNVVGRYRDEKAIVVSADVRVSGKVKNGSGLGAFVNRRLQPSGRFNTYSGHVGAESEVLPGRLRLRAGS